MSRSFAKWFANYDNPNSIGSIMRAKRIVPLLEMIKSVFNQKGTVSIIDLGGTEKYWNIVPEQFLNDHNVTITIVNRSEPRIFGKVGRFKYIKADACDLADIVDQSYDIAHSNSVVEHVGEWERMIQFAKEGLIKVST